MKKRAVLAFILSASLLGACSGDFLNKEYDIYGNPEQEELDIDKEKDKEEEKEKEEKPDTEKPTEAEKPVDEPAEKPTEKPAEDEKPEKPVFNNRPNATTGTGNPKELSEGDVAPDFTVNLKDGSSLTLSDYDDRIVLLNFWATWCPPCVGEMPALQRLHEDMGDEVLILGVDCGESRSDVNSFISENGYTYPIAYDEDYAVEDYYPTDGIPYTLIIDHGVIHEIFVGAYDADTMYKEYSSAIEACK